MREIAKEFHRLFKDDGVNKILTIEASGIAIGALVAEEFGCPLVFAKKTKTKNIAGDVYTSKVESFTHGTTYDIIVSKRLISEINLACFMVHTFNNSKRFNLNTVAPEFIAAVLETFFNNNAAASK